MIGGTAPDPLMEALFSSDSDGDSDGTSSPGAAVQQAAATAVAQQQAAQAAVEAARARKSREREHRAATSSQASHVGGPSPEAPRRQERTALHDPLGAFSQWPLVQLVELGGVGGGRGVCTTQDVRAGTVLMREAPFVPPSPSWAVAAACNHDDGGGAATALHTVIARELMATGVARTSPELQLLHPRTLDAPDISAEALRRAVGADNVDQSLLSSVAGPPRSAVDGDGGGDCRQAAAAVAAPVHEEGQLKPCIGSLLESATAAASRGSAEPPPHAYTRSEVLRLILALRFNAFESGLYYALAMINHDCSPNCSKLSPSADDDPRGQQHGGYSEIVACTDIPAGTEVTIHYAMPLERSWSWRRGLFAQQHCFDLAPSPFPDGIDDLLPAETQERCSALESELDALDTHCNQHQAGRGADDDQTEGLALLISSLQVSGSIMAAPSTHTRRFMYLRS
jgi:hypothetical protein